MFFQNFSLKKVSDTDNFLKWIYRDLEYYCLVCDLNCNENPFIFWAHTPYTQICFDGTSAKTSTTDVIREVHAVAFASEDNEISWSVRDKNKHTEVCHYVYDVKALIGRGSFSRVVRVEHRATRRPFAIKMMEVKAPGGREVCASELAVLRRVSHANVIQLVEVLQTPQRVYMVLELATGGELLDRVVTTGRFTERDATRALRMVLAAVGYLHGLGITHRDLKPENLLYYHPGADSRLLVTDFGLATFGDDWSLRTTCGTPEYMAPEMVLRRPYSCAVDMWALGVIAYIVLSGSMPFEDDSRTRLYRAILRGKYSFRGDPWPSVSSPAKDFIQHLLASDPAARLTAEQAIRHPWVATMAAGSSMRNLHRSISQNLRQRASRTSSRCPSSTGGLSRASSSNKADRKKNVC
uniref:Si:ch211-27e6.1 n=1 Tax=Myripristis murdjan TaxID=586833 RepID=A0A667XDY1_9TELE